MSDADKVHVLLINTGANPITTEKHVLEASDPSTVQNTILSGINRLGKLAHALIRYKTRYWVCDHTARKGASKEYYKHEVRYHPYMKELA